MRSMYRIYLFLEYALSMNWLTSSLNKNVDTNLVKRLTSQINQKSESTITNKDLNKQESELGYGHICQREENFDLIDNYI